MTSSAKVSINVDLYGIEKKFSKSAVAKGKLALGNQMLLDMDRFVPKKDGDLRKSGRLERDVIVYDKPYARAQFYGSSYTRSGKKFVFRKYSTAGTGKRWDLKAKALYMRKWQRKAWEGMMNG